jgi:hypothetical protein
MAMRFALPVIVFFLLTTPFCFGQDVAKQISATTAELEKQLNTLQVSPELKQRCTADIASARGDLKLGYTQLGLYTIRTCQSELTALTFANKNDSAFQDEALKLSSQIADQVKKQPQPSEKSSQKQPPALIAALSELSRAEANANYQSAQTLAQNKNIGAASSSLGRAKANIDYVFFVRSLHFPEPKTPFILRSIAPELTKFEASALRTFKSADARRQQTEYTGLASSLKVATALNEASAFAGALLKYLEAQLEFGLIITTAENEDLIHLQLRSEEVGKMLMEKKTDHSIALLFWQIAETNLKPASGEAPTQAQLRNAVVILNKVLPSYFDYLKEKR